MFHKNKRLPSQKGFPVAFLHPYIIVSNSTHCFTLSISITLCSSIHFIHLLVYFLSLVIRPCEQHHISCIDCYIPNPPAYACYIVKVSFNQVFLTLNSHDPTAHENQLQKCLVQIYCPNRKPAIANQQTNNRKPV